MQGFGVLNAALHLVTTELDTVNGQTFHNLTSPSQDIT
jgi:hypothetical protein